jgi:transcriptional regulator with XRE-family HTH domain
MDAERIYKNLGNRIRDLRRSLGLTQDQLAKQVGISRASLANIERGKQQVLVHHVFALADGLQLESPAQLLLAPQGGGRKRGAAADLPLSGEGLTDKQRQEVLRLMGGVLENNNYGNPGDNAGREDR